VEDLNEETTQHMRLVKILGSAGCQPAPTGSLPVGIAAADKKDPSCQFIPELNVFAASCRERQAGSLRSPGNANSLGREEIDPVEGGDDLAACEQFLQIVAIAELFVAEKAEPESFGRRTSRVRFDHGSRIEHGRLLKQRTCHAA
jgi:hypothetical protein